MKRDIDLLRKIMLQVEATNFDEIDLDWVYLNDDFFSKIGGNDNFVVEHINLLNEAGLLEHLCGQWGAQTIRLTNKGFDFLDCVRNDDVWHTVKERIAITGGAPLEVIKWLAQEEVRKVVR
jgi:hypothetical protein